jgi:hypothetical protein
MGSSPSPTPSGGDDFYFVAGEVITAVILRSALLRASKDGREHDTEQHPSRRAKVARASSDNGEAVARG